MVLGFVMTIKIHTLSFIFWHTPLRDAKCLLGIKQSRAASDI